MPILVQWKWVERTKTFLVIFHLYDDYSRPNIRLNKKTFKDEGVEFERPTITWSPSHPELGLLSELLSYANIINGLKETEKRKLRRDLEIAVDEGNGHLHLYWYPIRDLLELQNKALLFETPDKCIFIRHAEWMGEPFEPRLYGDDYEKKIKGENWFFCIELCPEYIDYLKNVMKEYL